MNKVIWVRTAIVSVVLLGLFLVVDKLYLNVVFKSDFERLCLAC